MAILKPKNFIQSVLIDEIDSLLDQHPYISFILMGIGIEFLGKCIDRQLTDWNVPRRSKHDFENAIKTIPSLQKYVPYLTSHDMYGSFRCGLAHAASPKYIITLSSKNESPHLLEQNGRLNFKVEDFYRDFKNACEFVINDNYPASDKMNLDFLEVPDISFNIGTNIQTGTTTNFNSSSGIVSASGTTHP